MERSASNGKTFGSEWSKFKSVIGHEWKQLKPVIRDESERLRPIVSRITLIAIRCIWVMAVIFYPLIQWPNALVALLFFIAMILHWNMPEKNSGWKFMGIFSVMVAFDYFVKRYRPKGLENVQIPSVFRLVFMKVNEENLVKLRGFISVLLK